MTKPLIWADDESAMFADDLADGSAFWDRDEANEPVAIMYSCPCGCKEFRRLPIKKGEKVPSAWAWDGNETAPTITPSIQHVRHKPTDCNWHGFITKGEWVTV